ncbi:MAG: hypothetical protein S4CHLAM6_13640 [Chlamydiae bacterium]|nr:hypothetical protein [Chlamydiota bacterium]
MVTPSIYGTDSSVEISSYPEAFQAYKKNIVLDFEYAAKSGEIQTLEGKVACAAGDAIMTGTQGERWPISKDTFTATYNVVEEGKASKKKIVLYVYQMKEIFKVKVSWSNSLLEGKADDYLVQYGPNDFGVVEKEIFKETYEVI